MNRVPVSAPGAASRKAGAEEGRARVAVRYWKTVESGRRANGADAPDPRGLLRLAKRLYAAFGRDATAAALALPLVWLPWACHHLRRAGGGTGYAYEHVAAELTWLLHRLDATQPDPLDAAAAWAELHWKRFLGVVLSGRKARKPGATWRRRATIAALVYRLGRLKRNFPYVVVPRNRIAAALKQWAQTVGEVLLWLDGEGVIEFKRGEDGEPECDHFGGVARTARYIARPRGRPRDRPPGGASNRRHEPRDKSRREGRSQCP